MADDMSRERSGAPEMRQLTALQRIQRRVDTTRNHLTALEDIESAARALYAQLSAEQKTIADVRLASLIPASEAAITRII